jgi:hypothetical protein
MAFLRNVLRTAKVDIDGVAAVLDETRGSEQRLRVVGAELNDEWPVGAQTLLTMREIKLPITCGLLAHGLDEELRDTS